LVGDNTDHREIAGSYILRQGLFYPVLFFIGTAARQKDHLPFEINPGGSCSFFAILNFMIYTKSVAKNYSRTRGWHDRRETALAFQKTENYAIKNSPIRLYIELMLIYTL